MGSLILLVRLVLRLVFWPLRALRAAVVGRRGDLVHLRIDGVLVELPERRRFLLARMTPPRTSLSAVRALVEAIARDPLPAGLLVELRPVRIGRASATALRDALLRLRAAGKQVVVALPLGGGTREVLVGAAATRVLASPQSTLLPLGVAVETSYLRRALDRLGVEPELLARGEYKTAGETFVRSSMSERQKEQLGAVLDTLHDELVGALATGRGVPPERASAWIDGGPYRAAEAVELGLLDAVGYEDELARLALPSAPAKPRLVDAGAYLRARRGLRLLPLRRPGIAVLEVRGPIVSRAPLAAPGRLAVDEPLVRALRRAREDRRVLGLVLHIDSPGGSALSSDRIHHEAARLAEKKPVVAYLANVAASGGYYVAAAAHRIVAQPTTLTGSIGVVLAHFVIAPLLERLGIDGEVLKRGARADMLSARRPLAADEREALVRELDGVYKSFVEVVARGRGRPPAEIEPLARGRIYSGARAHELGLVDELGGFERAVEEVRRRAGRAAAHAEPFLLRPPREALQPLEIPSPFVAAFERLAGDTLLVDALAVATGVAAAERVLYWSGLPSEG